MIQAFTVTALVKAMHSAGDDLKARVSELVDRSARGLVADHKAQMPRGTKPHPAGMDQRRLADRVTVFSPNDFLRVVYSNAPHLHFVELGTRQRTAQAQHLFLGGRWVTTTKRGAMPKMGPVFVPLAAARRAEMLRAAEILVGRDREL